MSRISVACYCGWKGRRKPSNCETDFHDGGPCSCRLGRCPKCSAAVYDSVFHREHMKLLASTTGGDQK